MDILGLTSIQQIRGVLTVSEADLPDEVLVAYAIDDDLAVDLDAWLPEWEAMDTEAQRRLLRLYAKYYCAWVIAGVAQNFILKKITDGSNEGQRSDTDGFKGLAESLWLKANKYRAMLVASTGAQLTTSPYTIISRVTPTRDVIIEARPDALG